MKATGFQAMVCTPVVVGLIAAELFGHRVDERFELGHLPIHEDDRIAQALQTFDALKHQRMLQSFGDGGRVVAFLKEDVRASPVRDRGVVSESTLHARSAVEEGHEDDGATLMHTRSFRGENVRARERTVSEDHRQRTEVE
jgi:hypothetical protein